MFVWIQLREWRHVVEGAVGDHKAADLPVSLAGSRILGKTRKNGKKVLMTLTFNIFSWPSLKLHFVVITPALEACGSARHKGLDRVVAIHVQGSNFDSRRRLAGYAENPFLGIFTFRQSPHSHYQLSHAET